MSFVSNRPRFLVRIKINELENIPRTTGYISCRWYMKDLRPKPKYRGKTKWEPIRGHRANFENYSAEFTTRIRTANRSFAATEHSSAEGNCNTNETRAKCLTDCLIVFEVYLEYSNKDNKTLIGKVELNLSEYAHTDEVVTNRYLLHESKVNSVLNLSIYMEQIKGETDFDVPPMKTSHIFDGISTILDEQRDRLAAGSNTTFTGGQGNNINAPGNKPVTSIPNPSPCQYNIHDIYKRSLAHSWNGRYKKGTHHSDHKSHSNTSSIVHAVSTMGGSAGITLALALNSHESAAMNLPQDALQLSPEECIEDIFAGGDGFGNYYQSNYTNDNEYNGNYNHGNSNSNHNRLRRDSNNHSSRSSGPPPKLIPRPSTPRRAGEMSIREATAPGKMMATSVLPNNNNLKNTILSPPYSSQNVPRDHQGLRHRSSQQQLQRQQQQQPQNLQLHQDDYREEIPCIDQKNRERYLKPYDNDNNSYVCWTIKPRETEIGT